jgi:MoaA/NifB/PqqE/SkfB family radical SAM enzyme
MSNISISQAEKFGHDFKQLVLTLGYRCNMLCKHCFIGEKLHDHDTILTYEDCIEAIESASKLQTIRTVAFVGGEPFVYYKLLLRVADYLHTHYRCALNITTNASWAKTPEMTQRLLDPLFERGLRHIMISLDQYHLEFGTIEHVANCIGRSQELGMDTAVQIIRRVGAPKEEDFRIALNPLVDIEKIRWYENPCSAIGNAHTMLSKEDLEWHEEIPVGGCNAGDILNIQPDGEIKPCCGAGLMAKRLSLGNAKREPVDEAVRRAEADPLINSLVAEQGPRGLARLLSEAGRQDLVQKHAPFTDACYACHSFLTDAETLEVLEAQLESRGVEMLVNRIMAVRSADVIKLVQERENAGEALP